MNHYYEDIFAKFCANQKQSVWERFGDASYMFTKLSRSDLWSSGVIWQVMNEFSEEALLPNMGSGKDKHGVRESSARAARVKMLFAKNGRSRTKNLDQKPNIYTIVIYSNYTTRMHTWRVHTCVLVCCKIKMNSLFMQLPTIIISVILYLIYCLRLLCSKSMRWEACPDTSGIQCKTTLYLQTCDSFLVQGCQLTRMNIFFWSTLSELSCFRLR